MKELMRSVGTSEAEQRLRWDILFENFYIGSEDEIISQQVLYVTFSLLHTTLTNHARLERELRLPQNTVARNPREANDKTTAKNTTEKKNESIAQQALYVTVSQPEPCFTTC